MIDTLAASPTVRAIGWALLQSLWQDVLVGAVTALALAGCGSKHASSQQSVAKNRCRVTGRQVTFPLLDRGKSSLRLDPLEDEPDHVDREDRRRIVERVGVEMSFVGEHSRYVFSRLSQEVPPRDNERNARGSRVFLRAGHYAVHPVTDASPTTQSRR